MSVGRICTRTIYTATSQEAARAGAVRMADKGVGSLVVVDEDGRPIGMVTDRDVAVRLVAKGLDADETPIGGIMSIPVHSVEEETPIESALGAMAGAGVRRSVVLDAEGKLVGILALDDVLELLVEETKAVGALIRSQAEQ
jgi:CBS domain-containing protein